MLLRVQAILLFQHSLERENFIFSRKVMISESKSFLSFMFDFEGTNHSLINIIASPPAMVTSIVHDDTVDGNYALKFL